MKMNVRTVMNVLTDKLDLTIQNDYVNSYILNRNQLNTNIRD